MFYYIIITLSIILIILGIIGLILPMFPSVPLVFAGILLHSIATSFASISAFTIFLMLIFTLISLGIGYVMSIYGAKYFGATKYGVWGGIIGIIIGILFSPLGLISIFILPPIGTLIGELIGGKKFLSSSKSSFGSLLGMFVGILADILIIAWMLYLFLSAIF